MGQFCKQGVYPFELQDMHEYEAAGYLLTLFLFRDKVTIDPEGGNDVSSDRQLLSSISSCSLWNESSPRRVRRRQKLRSTLVAADRTICPKSMGFPHSPCPSKSSASRNIINWRHMMVRHT